MEPNQKNALKNAQDKKNAQGKIVEEFSQLPGWEERYRRIIDLGKELKPLSEEFKTEDLKVKGCQSQVWIHAELNSKNQVVFTADSDALIVKGLIALLLKVYSEQTPEFILKTQPDFISELELGSHLSPSRANGLFAMIKQIKFYALAFQSKLENTR